MPSSPRSRERSSLGCRRGMERRVPGDRSEPLTRSGGSAAGVLQVDPAMLVLWRHIVRAQLRAQARSLGLDHRAHPVAVSAVMLGDVHLAVMATPGAQLDRTR